MAINTYGDCNVFARLFDWVNELALGSKTYSHGEVRVSNTVGIGANLRWLLLAQETSGTGTIEVFLSDASGPNLSDSADFTLTLSNTNEDALDFVTADDKQYVTLRVTDTSGSGGQSLAKNMLMVFDEMQIVNGVRQGYHEAVAGFEKVPQTTAYAPVSLAAQ